MKSIRTAVKMAENSVSFLSARPRNRMVAKLNGRPAVHSKPCRIQSAPFAALLIYGFLLQLTSPAAAFPTSPKKMNITIALAGKPAYSTTLKGFVGHYLGIELVANGNQLTLLAPTNSAFDNMPKAASSDMTSLNMEPYVLRSHVLIGYHNYSALYAMPDGTMLDTLAGPMVEVTGGLPGGRVKFVSQTGGESYLVDPDVVLNGDLAVQGIDAILIPSGVAQSPLPAVNLPVPPPLPAPPRPSPRKP